MSGITKPYWRGLIDGYKGLHNFKADRQNLQKNRKVKYKALIGALAWSPFSISTRKGKNWPYKAD